MNVVDMYNIYLYPLTAPLVERSKKLEGLTLLEKCAVVILTIVSCVFLHFTSTKYIDTFDSVVGYITGCNAATDKVNSAYHSSGPSVIPTVAALPRHVIDPTA